ncbi:TolC family protein [Salmonella enterica]|nr:TolC family protein [Salmonella enterica]ECE0742000.1 TolC family protein [Salmonella enterica subsp. enterica serovar Hvittingfoss]EGA8118247.1 TolC family protein [Salmonella enterica]EHO8673526.1 TolC family protein [Salmonella enterica]MJE82367.1 TolC family protein [Salmonella enterica]
MIKYNFYFLFLFVPGLAISADYHDFMARVYKDSDVIKSKIYELEAEESNAVKTDYFFAPKVKLNSTYKNDSSNKKYLDSTGNISSLLYDSTLPERFMEKNARLSNALVSLNMEKENQAKSVLENAISIQEYNKLNSRAHELSYSAKHLFEQINNRYKNGTAGQSDLQQARLLVQKIDGDIRRIEQEIENFHSNIEIMTGLDYPDDGVDVSFPVINNIIDADIKKNQIKENLSYKQLSYQAEEAKQNSAQQNSLLQVSLQGVDRRNNQHRLDNDTYVGLSVDFNIFDLDKISGKSQKLNEYRSIKSKMDHKYKELDRRINQLNLQYNSSDIELKNYEMQLDTTRELIKSQKMDYELSKVSYYEMLNTEYDFFQLQSKVADTKIKKISNRLEVLALAGKILEL